MSKEYTQENLDESQTLKERKKREEKSKLRDKKWVESIEKIASSTDGRQVLWRILEKCKVFNSVWEPSAKIHYNSGKQDLGHWLMAEIIRTNENILFKMMAENKQGVYDE